MDNKNIAQEIVKGVSTMKNIFLRPVMETDCKLLFEWRNEPSTRQNSFNRDEITYEEHLAWFEKMLSNKNCGQYILMQDEVAVGQIRIFIDGSSAEISYNVCENFQGRGLGTKMVELLEYQIKIDFPQIETLVAKVKLKNSASRKIFEKNLFEKSYIVYKKNLTTKNDGCGANFNSL